MFIAIAFCERGRLLYTCIKVAQTRPVVPNEEQNAQRARENSVVLKVKISVESDARAGFI